MNRRVLIALLLTSSLFLFSCAKDLELHPISYNVGTALAFEDLDKAQGTIEGLYRATFQINSDFLWAAGNVQQNIGVREYSQLGDLMGSDYVMAREGNGWYAGEYTFYAMGIATSSAWRPYAWWNFTYKLVTNINTAIAGISKIDAPGQEDRKNAMLGVLHGLRAYVYHNAALFFCQHVQHHPDALGLPIYTEPTGSSTEGKPRGTVADTYAQIEKDIQISVSNLDSEWGKSKLNRPIEFDYYVANAVAAQIYLHMAKYEEALIAAEKVIKSGNFQIETSQDLALELPLTVDRSKVGVFKPLGSGFNNVSTKSIVWGATMVEQETGQYGSFWSHFDNVEGAYAKSAPKCMHSKLAEWMSLDDPRRSWVMPGDVESAEAGLPFPYALLKYRSTNMGKGMGDILYIRYEEVLLIAAEAQVRLKKFDTVKNHLDEFLTVRFGGDAAKVPDKYKSDDLDGMELTEYPEGSTYKVKNALDAVIMQKRLELIGEGSRFQEMKRLHQRMFRDGEFKALGGNYNWPADHPNWASYIPQREIDSNPLAKQNPPRDLGSHMRVN